jgi:hypothetical protein
MKGFFDQIAEPIWAQVTRAPFGGVTPLAALVVAGLLMALVLLLPATLEALARGFISLRRRLAQGVRTARTTPSAQGGVGTSDAPDRSKPGREERRGSYFTIWDTRGPF